MTRATKATINIIILICVSVVCFLYFYDFPKRVNLIRDAVVYTENDPSTTISTKINIDGTLYQPLFKQNIFKGNLYIEAYEFTKENRMIDIPVTRENGINMGGLVYHAKTNSPGLLLSMIWFDDDFQNINIWTTPSWGQNSDKEPRLFIVTGNNYEQALKTQHVMREKFGEAFVPK